MKKISAYFLLSIIFVCSLFYFSGCKKNEIDSVSKNLTIYAISAKLDDESKTISATETITFINKTGKTLEYLCFHLYARAFRRDAVVRPYSSLSEASCFPNGLSFGDIAVSKVFIGEEELSYFLVGQDENILKVELKNNLNNGEKVNLTIEFLLTIPNSTHRLGYFEDNINVGNWYPIVCMFDGDDFDMTPYFSTGDPFYSDIANYEVELAFPNCYEIASTGDINISENETGKVAKISAKAVRDFAFCLSSNSKMMKNSKNGVSVSVLANLSEEEILKILKIATEAVEFFSGKFGEYPYTSLMVAITPFIYGGMEYPNLALVSNSIESNDELLKVVVHEIAHQWWYGIVGNNEAKEAWLDESLSEYSSALFFKHHADYKISYDEFVESATMSYSLYVDVIKSIRGEVNTKMNLPVNEYKNDYEYSYMVYVKGVIMFDSLRNMVGEDKVVLGLRRYYQDNKFKIATKEDFLKAFKKACHKDLDGFFEGFLDGSAIISAIN